MTGQRIHRLLKLVKLLQSGERRQRVRWRMRVKSAAVSRDLELLRQSEIGIEFDDERQSFVMNGCRSLPATTFTAAEALAVLALCYHVGNAHGLPFFEDATSAALKIESNLPQHLRDELSEQLWSLELSLAPLNQLTGKRTTYQAVVRAVARKRSLRIRYFDATERAKSPRGSIRIACSLSSAVGTSSGAHQFIARRGRSTWIAFASWRNWTSRSRFRAAFRSIAIWATRGG